MALGECWEWRERQGLLPQATHIPGKSRIAIFPFVLPVKNSPQGTLYGALAVEGFYYLVNLSKQHGDCLGDG